MIINGSIYICNGKKIRVITNDENVVCYEPWDENEKTWYFEKARSVSFYWLKKKLFLERYKLIQELEFTKEEFLMFRPDLPIILNRFEGIFWTNEIFENLEKFSEFLISNKINVDRIEGINTNKIFIEPSGPSGPTSRYLKPELITTENENISGIELLYQCFNIESKYIKNPENGFTLFRLGKERRLKATLKGIGLYRSGYKKKLPTYYIGAFRSFADAEYK